MDKKIHNSQVPILCKKTKGPQKFYLLKQLILPASLGSQAHNMCKEMQYKEPCKNTVK